MDKQFSIKEYKTVPNVSGIYKIYSPDDVDTVYVGSSVNLRNRIYQHFHQLTKGRHHSKSLQESNIDKLVFEIVEECSVEELYDRECFWIEHYDAIHNGHNSKQPNAVRPAGNRTKEDIEEFPLDLFLAILDALVTREINADMFYEYYRFITNTSKDDTHFKYKRISPEILKRYKLGWKIQCAIGMNKQLAEYFSCDLVKDLDDFIVGDSLHKIVKHISSLQFDLITMSDHLDIVSDFLDTVSKLLKRLEVRQ